MSWFPDALEALQDPSLPFPPARRGCNQISMATCRGAKTLFPEEEMPGPTGQPLPSAPLTQSTQESAASETKLSLDLSWLGKLLCFNLRIIFPQRSSPEKADGHRPLHCKPIQMNSARAELRTKALSPGGDCVALKRLQLPLSGTN